MDCFQLVKTWDTHKLQEAISLGCDVNIKDGEGNTPLHWAAWNRFSECTHVLIRAGAHLNAANSYRETPLFIATLQGHLDCIQLLLNAGANLEYGDIYGMRPLHRAVLSKHERCLPLFIQSQVNLNAPTLEGNTPLHYAAKTGNLAFIRKLLHAGADPSLRNTAGVLPEDFCQGPSFLTQQIRQWRIDYEQEDLRSGLIHLDHGESDEKQGKGRQRL